MKRPIRQRAWFVVAAILVAMPLAAHAERGRHVARKAPKAGATKGRAAADSPASAPAPTAAVSPASAPAPTAAVSAAGEATGDAVESGLVDEAAAGLPDDAPSASNGDDEAPGIQTLGEEGMRAHFVDHEGPWSLHAEALPTDYLFRLWREIGGPEVVSLLPIDRTYTISVHREPAERILGRLLDGYGYTLHYDGDGRLELVRVYSPAPNAGAFKTPRLVESLSAWRDVELAPATAAQSN